MTVWLHDWKEPQDYGTSREALLRDFEISAEALAGFDVLLASYGEAYGYDGEAFVLLKRQSDGQLFEVNGAHCSCYGLEGQWKPDETSLDALLYRLDNGELGRAGDASFADELRALLAGMVVPA